MSIFTNKSTSLSILTTIAAVFVMMAPALAGETAEEIANEKGILSGSLADAAWTIAAFGLLVVLLGKTVWRPMLNGLKARQEHIAQQIAIAETSRKQADELLSDYNKQMEGFEAKGQVILKERILQAEEESRQIAEKSRQESLAIRGKTQEDIERSIYRTYRLRQG